MKRVLSVKFSVVSTIAREIIEHVPSLGLYLEDLGSRVENVIVVAGGAKAGAIAAVVGNHPRDYLVLDEGAAKKLWSFTGKEKQGLILRIKIYINAYIKGGRVYDCKGRDKRVWKGGEILPARLFQHPEVDVVAVNSIRDPKLLAHC